jgi:hypothetical protein
MLQRACASMFIEIMETETAKKGGEAAVMALEECPRTKPREVTTLYFRMDNPPSTEMA